MTRRVLMATLSASALLSALLVATTTTGGALEAGDTIVVDTTDDGDDADLGDDECATASGACTLRAALYTAQAIHEDGVTTVIEVPAGEYVLDEDLYLYNANVVVRGAGAGQTIVRATDSRHLTLNRDGELIVTLEDMTFTGGVANDQDPLGGSIYSNAGTVTVRRMHFEDNSAGWSGGAIASLGDLFPNTLVVEDSTFVANTAALNGGAIMASRGENVTIRNSTFTGNAAAFGGAVSAGDPESPGGANVTILHATFAGNTASGFQGGDAAGGALFAEPDGSITLTSSIVEDSTEGPVMLVPVAIGDPVPNCGTADGGTITSGGGNVVDDASCSTDQPTDQPDTAANVGELADNGGPTFTMALTADSPAVDAAGATCSLATDQRGEARPQDGDGDGTSGCDSGAFELAGAAEEPTTTTTTTPPEPTSPPAAQPVRQTPSYTG